LIHTSWGGTIAEAWTSAEALNTLDDFRPAVARLPSMTLTNNPNIVTVLYNGMIAPVIPYGIKRAIWYQGESNAGRAYQYRTLLPPMIKDWQSRWGAGELPFCIVQLATVIATDKELKDDAWPYL